MKLYDLEQSAQKGLTDSNIRHDAPKKSGADPAFDGIFSNLSQKRDFSKIRI